MSLFSSLKSVIDLFTINPIFRFASFSEFEACILCPPSVIFLYSIFLSNILTFTMSSPCSVFLFSYLGFSSLITRNKNGPLPQTTFFDEEFFKLFPYNLKRFLSNSCSDQ